MGGLIKYKRDASKEIQETIKQCMHTMTKLQILWKNSLTSITYKLVVANAALRSKLLYGTESIQFTPAAIRRLNTFQLKILRKILGLKTTFIDRANTNNKVFEIVNELLKKHKKRPLY